MIVNDVENVVDVETARGQIGAYQNVGTAVGKAVEGGFAPGLFESAMKQTGREASLAKKFVGALHALTMIEEDDGTLAVQGAEQQVECVEFVFRFASHLEHLDALLYCGIFVEIVDADNRTDVDEVGDAF